MGEGSLPLEAASNDFAESIRSYRFIAVMDRLNRPWPGAGY
jgi:hypothetical protein